MSEGRQYSHVLEPLHRDRIKRCLEGEQLRYLVDEDGNVQIGFEAGIFFITVQGPSEEIMLASGTWNKVLDIDDRQRAREICDEWNCDKVWPKTFTQITDSGELRISCEHSVDYEHGLTDAQLVQHLTTMFATALSFFERLDEAFPWAKRVD